MRPRVGRSRPASNRSNVLLPAPEGPKITVHPDAKAHSTSRWKLPRCASSKNSSMAARRSVLLSPGIEKCQSDDAHPKQDGGGVVGGGIVEVLNLVIKNDGERPCRAGNIAAEHENHAELTDGMQKAEHDGSEQRTPCKRNQNAR